MKYNIIVTIARQETAAYKKGDYLITLERIEVMNCNASDLFVAKSFVNRDNAINFANKMGLLFDCKVNDETL